MRSGGNTTTCALSYHLARQRNILDKLLGQEKCLCFYTLIQGIREYSKVIVHSLIALEDKENPNKIKIQKFPKIFSKTQTQRGFMSRTLTLTQESGVFIFFLGRGQGNQLEEESMKEQLRREVII